MILAPGEVAEHATFGWRGVVLRVTPSPYSITWVRGSGEHVGWYTVNVVAARGPAEDGEPWPKVDLPAPIT